MTALQADLYLSASGYKGVVAEAMEWSRALSSQEVQELFFRPLTRIVAKGGISGWILTVTAGAGATTSPSGYINVASGQSVNVSAAIFGNYWFSGWVLDGVGKGKANPITVPAQTDGSVHTLIAQTSSPSAKNTQFYIINIPISH